MIYTPKYFAVDDIDRSVRLIRAFPFATLVSGSRGAVEPIVSHLPLLVRNSPGSPGSDDGQELRLIGHLASANPQIRCLKEGRSVTAIFHGPHSYITPRWYSVGDVPTWNYAVVHATGTPRLMEEESELLEALKELSVRFDPQWNFEIPEDLAEPGVVMKAICGFEIRVEKLEGKFKLSQNRSAADRNGVIQGLSSLGDEMSLGVRDLMKENELIREGKQIV